MMKFKIFGILCAALAIFAINSANAAEETLADYLIDKEVSFMIVHVGADVILTTFDGQPAKESCKTIKLAGFDITAIRNYTGVDRIETNAEYKN